MLDDNVVSTYQFNEYTQNGEFPAKSSLFAAGKQDQKLNNLYLLLCRRPRYSIANESFDEPLQTQIATTKSLRKTVDYIFLNRMKRISCDDGRRQGVHDGLYRRQKQGMRCISSVFIPKRTGKNKRSKHKTEPISDASASGSGSKIQVVAATSVPPPRRGSRVRKPFLLSFSNP